MAFIRKVKTASGATAVQMAFKEKGKVVRIIHIGSAHTDEDLRVLLAIAHNKLHAKQPELFPEAASSFRVEIRQTIRVYFGKSYNKNIKSLDLRNCETMYLRLYVLQGL